MLNPQSRAKAMTQYAHIDSWLSAVEKAVEMETLLTARAPVAVRQKALFSYADIAIAQLDWNVDVRYLTGEQVSRLASGSKAMEDLTDMIGRTHVR